MTVHFFSSRKIKQKNILFRFAKQLCRPIKALRGQGEICIILVSDNTIRKINRGFLNHDRTTDVIAFRYPGLKNRHPRNSGGAKPFGDIFISLDTAKRQAREGRHSTVQEIALLILHGLLHLAGYRDDTLNHRKKMFKRQRVLFHEINPSLAPPDFQ